MPSCTVTTQPDRFRDDWQAFRTFVRRPTARRYRYYSREPGRAWHLDVIPQIRLGRLLAWAVTLWLVNLLVLGPIVVAVAGMSGATHRIDVHNIPWVLAILWAPLIEEMVFRYGLRKPLQAIWLVPILIPSLLFGMTGGSGWWLAIGLLLCCWACMNDRPPSRRSWRVMRAYRFWFPWVFHTVTLAFAGLHIKNFIFTDFSWWMLPVLVLPQWFSGLVLGWIRVSRGIGAAILLHAVFNLGPLLMAWALVGSA